MTDKELIKQEIERRIDLYSIAEKDDSTFARMGELSSLIDLINSLPEEPASEDLEEELTKYIESKFTIDKEQLDRFGIKPDDYTFSLDKEDILNFAQHFAEWQKKKDQETIELAEDHAMLAGMNKMKEEMMKYTVENIVEDWCGESPEITIPLNPQDFKTGDKVKIIVIKEEQ